MQSTRQMRRHDKSEASPSSFLLEVMSLLGAFRLSIKKFKGADSAVATTSFTRGTRDGWRRRLAGGGPTIDEQ